jgi:hypothetical protein
MSMMISCQIKNSRRLAIILLLGSVFLASTACSSGSGNHAEAAAASGSGAAGLDTTPAMTSVNLTADDVARLDDLERRNFNYFWVSANPTNGLIPDNYPAPKMASIAAIGFGLSAYIVGAERGYITRAQALSRATQVIEFLLGLPEGAQATGVARYHGFYYHFLDMQTGLRYRNSELSTIDTTLLLGGVLSVQQYFNGASADEAHLRDICQTLYNAVDWTFVTHADGSVAMGWSPEQGLYTASWTGYNEAMLLVVLGLGSPTHPLSANAWQAWTSTYSQYWKYEYGEQYLSFPSLFVHQYSHIWIDFRNIQDTYMASRGLDYFQNSRRAVYAQYRYAQANPFHYKDYGQPLWGVTASDGPGVAPPAGSSTPTFYGYAGRGLGGPAYDDDGTIAPTGALASIAFAPELVVPTLSQYLASYPYLYSDLGFLDAINPSVPDGTVVTAGQVLPGHGWVDTQYLGIDQGPILLMAENYRSALLWNLMRQHPAIISGLRRAGFQGGWLAQTP